MMETIDIETTTIQTTRQSQEGQAEEEQAVPLAAPADDDDKKYHSPLWARMRTRSLIAVSKLGPGTVALLTGLLFLLLIWDFDPDNSTETPYDTSAHMVRFTAEDAIPEQPIILASATPPP